MISLSNTLTIVNSIFVNLICKNVNQRLAQNMKIKQLWSISVSFIHFWNFDFLSGPNDFADCFLCTNYWRNRRLASSTQSICMRVPWRIFQAWIISMSTEWAKKIFPLGFCCHQLFMWYQKSVCCLVISSLWQSKSVSSSFTRGSRDTQGMFVRGYEERIRFLASLL